MFSAPQKPDAEVSGWLVAQSKLVGTALQVWTWLQPHHMRQCRLLAHPNVHSWQQGRRWHTRHTQMAKHAHHATACCSCTVHHSNITHASATLTRCGYHRQPAADHCPLLLKHAKLPGKLDRHICCVRERQQLLGVAGRQAHSQVKHLRAAEKPAAPTDATAAAAVSGSDAVVRAAATAAAVAVGCGSWVLAEAAPVLPLPANMDSDTSLSSDHSDMNPHPQQALWGFDGCGIPP